MKYSEFVASLNLGTPVQGTDLAVVVRGGVPARIPASEIAEAAAAVAAHVANADPHVQYQRETEKGVAGGYPSLDVDGLIPDAQIPAGISRDAEINAAMALAISGAIDSFAASLPSIYTPLATLPAKYVFGLGFGVAAQQTAINAQIAAATGPTRFILCGQFNINRPFWVDGKSDVWIEGAPGNEIRMAADFLATGPAGAGSGVSSAVSFSQANNCGVVGLNINGATNQAASNGIGFYPSQEAGNATGIGCTNFHIHRNRIYLRQDHSYHLHLIRGDTFWVSKNYCDGGLPQLTVSPTPGYQQEGAVVMGCKNGWIFKNQFRNIGNNGIVCGAYEVAGTAVSATTNAAGYAVGATVINLANAGTGVILKGDVVTFGTADPTQYQVTVGDADVSNGGSITIAAPGLRIAIPASATAITMRGQGPESLYFEGNHFYRCQRAIALFPTVVGGVVYPMKDVSFSRRNIIDSCWEHNVLLRVVQANTVIEGVKMDGNIFRGAPAALTAAIAYAVFIENQLNSAANITMRRVSIDDNELYDIATKNGQGQITARYVKGLSIRRNKLYKTFALAQVDLSYGIFVLSNVANADIYIEGNEVDGTYYSSIYFFGGSGYTADGNTCLNWNLQTSGTNGGIVADGGASVFSVRNNKFDTPNLPLGGVGCVNLANAALDKYVAGNNTYLDYSNNINNVLMYYIATGRTWAVGTVVTVGQVKKPLAGSTNYPDMLMRCIRKSGTGTTHATTEPTWVNGDKAIVIDNPGANQVVWQMMAI